MKSLEPSSMFVHHYPVLGSEALTLYNYLCCLIDQLIISFQSSLREDYLTSLDPPLVPELLIVSRSIG